MFLIFLTVALWPKPWIYFISWNKSLWKVIHYSSKLHEKQIWFTTHVLAAAKWHQPGITNNGVETASTTVDIMVAQDVLVQNAEASSSSVFSDVVMQDTNAPLSGLANQDIIMQGPDAPYSEVYSMPELSSDINMHHPAIPALPQIILLLLYSMMERLAKERITRSIVSLLRYVL